MLRKLLFAGALALAAFSATADIYTATYGVAKVFPFWLYNADGTLDVDEADGGTEVALSCNQGAETTATNDFVDEGTHYSISLTAAELQCQTVVVVVNATVIGGFIIETVGNASAFMPTAEANVASVTDGALVAADFATDAFTAAKFASDVGTEFANATWALDATGQQTQGTFGQVLGDSAADTDSVWAKANFLPSAVAGATGGVFIAGTNAATTITTGLTTTFTGNVTGSVGSVTGAVGSVTGAVGSVGTGGITAASIAADAIGASEVAADVSTELLTGLANLAVNVAQISTDSAAADALELAFDGTATGARLLGIDRLGTAQSATGTTLVVDSGAAYGDNTLAGVTAVACGSTQGYCQSLPVASNVGATDTLTLDGAWPVTPSGTISFYLFGTAPSTGGSGLDAAGVRAAVGLASANLDTQLTAIDDYVDTEVAAILVDTGTTLDDLVDDLESRLGTPSDLGGGATLAANASDIEAQTDDIGAAGAGLTATDDAIMTRVGAPVGASISADIAAAKTDTTAILLDTGTDGVVVAAASKTGYVLSAAGVDAIWDETQAGHVTAGTFGLYLDAPVSSGAGGGLDAAGVRAAVGLATANLDTQLTAIDNFVDTEVADILVDTGTTLQGELDGIQADTEDLQVQVGVAGAGLTAADDAVMTRLGAPAGASVSADIAAVEGQTDDIGVAGAGLTAIDDAVLAAIEQVARADAAIVNCTVNTAFFAGSTTTVACILTDRDDGAITAASNDLEGRELLILSGAQLYEGRFINDSIWDAANSELRLTLSRALPSTLADAVTAIIR